MLKEKIPDPLWPTPFPGGRGCGKGTHKFKNGRHLPRGVGGIRPPKGFGGGVGEVTGTILPQLLLTRPILRQFQNTAEQRARGSHHLPMTNKEGPEEEGAATCQGPAVAGVTKRTTESVYTCRLVWGSPGASGSWVSFSGAASGLRDSRHKQVRATPTSQHGYGARGPEKRRDCAAQFLHKPAGVVHKTFAQNLCNTNSCAGHVRASGGAVLWCGAASELRGG